MFCQWILGTMMEIKFVIFRTKILKYHGNLYSKCDFCHLFFDICSYCHWERVRWSQWGWRTDRQGDWKKYVWIIEAMSAVQLWASKGSWVIRPVFGPQTLSGSIKILHRNRRAHTLRLWSVWPQGRFVQGCVTFQIASISSCWQGFKRAGDQPLTTI